MGREDVEHDDVKIAENWWSGTSGSAGAAGQAKPVSPPESSDWDTLRQKFVSSHDPEPAVKRAHSSRLVRVLVLCLAVGVILLGGLALLLFGTPSVVPTQIQESLDGMFTDAPSGSTPSADAPKQIPQNRKMRRAGKSGPAKRPVAVSDPGVEEEGPFTIEVIDRNRRTVMHAYQDPLQMDIEQPTIVPGSAPDVPSLVIEETLKPDGSLRTTTNVGASVVLSGVIGTDGKMRDLTVVRGPSEFVPAAMEAVRRWRFAVAQHHGFPAARAARVTVNMAIKADGQTSPLP